MRKKARIPEMIIAISTAGSCDKDKPICWIEAETPVLALFIEYKVTNDNPKTIMFILPNKTRKSSFSFESEIFEAITAACPLPNAGRKEHKGEAINEDNNDFK